MAKKENKFFSEIKNQIIAGVGLVIAAGFGIFITNMESWLSPKEEVQQPPIMEQRINPPVTSKDTIVISKTIVIPPKKEEKEEEITW